MHPSACFPAFLCLSLPPPYPPALFPRFALLKLADCGRMVPGIEKATYPEVGEAAFGKAGRIAAWFGMLAMTLGVCGKCVSPSCARVPVSVCACACRCGCGARPGSCLICPALVISSFKLFVFWWVSFHFRILQFRRVHCLHFNHTGGHRRL